MATYAEIIAKIDDAIYDWIDKPVTISHNNRTTTFRTLDELLQARAKYVKLQSVASSGGGLRFSNIKAGGVR